MALWLCYGDIVYDNLSRKIKKKTKDVQCVDCGDWFEVDIKDNETCRCDDCRKKHLKEIKKLQNRRAYEKRKLSRSQNI